MRRGENGTKIEFWKWDELRPASDKDGQMLLDEAQGTAVVLQYFATEEDMKAGAAAFGAMDASETPGTRASVDMCEIKLERELS